MSTNFEKAIEIAQTYCESPDVDQEYILRKLEKMLPEQEYEVIVQEFNLDI